MVIFNLKSSLSKVHKLKAQAGIETGKNRKQQQKRSGRSQGQVGVWVGGRQPATKLFTRNFIKTINHAVGNGTTKAATLSTPASLSLSTSSLASASASRRDVKLTFGENQIKSIFPHSGSWR